MHTDLGSPYVRADGIGNSGRLDGSHPRVAAESEQR
ncbi:MAG: hypothetical protein ACI9W2_001030 [Gammaproteobacteria bacterium]|jgi:hypothetical protein